MNDETPRKRRIIKKRESPIVNALYIVFWLAIFFMFSWLFVSQMESYNELQAELTRVNASVSREEAENERLQMQMTFFDSDAYIEQLARDRLGMVRQGEIVFRNTAE
jgi:cell division protein FtsB